MQWNGANHVSLVAKERFIGGDERAYLLTAGEGLVPSGVLDATRRYFENKVRAAEGRHRHETVDQACRTKLAGLMRGATAGDIALLGSTSEGVNAIYSLIDWQAGDNIVLPVNALEFPSTVLPAAKRERAGVEVRAVGHHDWVISPKDIASAVDDRTRLVFLSHVSYRTGHRFDLNAVGDAIRRANPGAIFAVDATQSLGVVPVQADACDFLVVTSCKWLLAPHGIGVFYWNRDRRPDIEPANIGWYSVVDDLQFPYELKPTAERFELGGPNLVAIYGMEPGLDILLETGVERIEQHVLRLGSRLLDGLLELPLEIITPLDPELRAGIVSWLDDDPGSTAAALSARGIEVTGSSGRIRAGIHLYNDDRDIDRLLDAMREITT
jgi:selenocysteine lyase/cysteine desulfurase